MNIRFLPLHTCRTLRIMYAELLHHMYITHTQVYLHEQILKIHTNTLTHASHTAWTNSQHTHTHVHHILHEQIPNTHTHTHQIHRHTCMNIFPSSR